MADTHFHEGSTGGAHGGDVSHEESDIQIGPIFKFLAWLTALGIVVQVVVWLMMGLFESQARQEEIQYPLAVGQQDRVPPEPRLQVTPERDLTTYVARERALLEGYSWVDKNAGIVRIPIEEAMKRVVAEGLPTRSTDAGERR
jgi:hypothetical protein